MSVAEEFKLENETWDLRDDSVKFEFSRVQQ